jgi:hypothetical protein
MITEKDVKHYKEAGYKQPPPVEDTESLVCADILKRQLAGIKKYNTTVAANQLQLEQWLQHQYEELLDAAIYCKRAIQELKK